MIDDDPPILYALRQYAEENERDFEVIWSTINSNEVETLLVGSRPDVLTVDLALPTAGVMSPIASIISDPATSGLTWIRRVKGQWPEIKVIAYTSYGEYVRDTIAAGADGFIMKGTPLKRVIDALRTVVRIGGFISIPELTAYPEVEVELPDAITQRTLDELGLSHLLPRLVENVRRRYGFLKRTLLVGLLYVQNPQPTKSEIARKLSMRPGTVHEDIKILHRKLGTHSGVELLQKFRSEGLF